MLSITQVKELLIKEYADNIKHKEENGEDEEYFCRNWYISALRTVLDKNDLSDKVIQKKAEELKA